MRSLTIALALAAVLAAGACGSGGPDPMAEGTNGQQEGRIDFSRTTAFDGNVLTVDLSSPGGGTLRVNTLRDAVETGVYRPPLPGHSGKSWVLRNFSHDSTSLVYAVASWSNDDPADYLAAGWWIHQPGREYDPDAIEYVIFIDGPEIDAAGDPPAMPVTGRARYSGEGGGIFRYAYGSGWGALEGAVALDEYRARMDVVADFDRGTLSGCLGCVGDIEADREHLAYVLGEDAAGAPSPVADYEIHFAPVAYGSGGTFESGFDGAAGSVRHPERRVMASRAFWGGSFSNVADAGGDPRLIGGFADAEFEEADGSGGFFWGLFNVLSGATVPVADAPGFPDGSAPGGAGTVTAPAFGPRLASSDLSPILGAEDAFDPDIADALARAARTVPLGASQSSLAEDGVTSDETTARVVRDDAGEPGARGDRRRAVRRAGSGSAAAPGGEPRAVHRPAPGHRAGPVELPARGARGVGVGRGGRPCRGVLGPEPVAGAGGLCHHIPDRHGQLRGRRGGASRRRRGGDQVHRRRDDDG